MIRYLLAVVATLLILSACATAQSQPVTPDPTTQPALTAADVSTILSLAVKDIQAQGYEPLFLNEVRGYIWVRDKAGAIKLYTLDTLIKAYQDGAK